MFSVDANPEPDGVEVGAKVEIPDLYCFTCEEQVGDSGGASRDAATEARPSRVPRNARRKPLRVGRGTPTSLLKSS